MTNEKIIAILNEVMVDKLDSIAFDIKYYLNTNYGITQTLDEDCMGYLKIMDKEEINELIVIRIKIKQLANKLKNKLKVK